MTFVYRRMLDADWLKGKYQGFLGSIETPGIGNVARSEERERAKVTRERDRFSESLLANLSVDELKTYTSIAEKAEKYGDIVEAYKSRVLIYLDEEDFMRYSNSLILIGRKDEVLQVLEAAVRNFPDNLDFSVMLGKRYFEVESYEKAAELYRKLHEDDTSNNDYLAGYSACLGRLGYNRLSKVYSSKMNGTTVTNDDFKLAISEANGEWNNPQINKAEELKIFIGSDYDTERNERIIYITGQIGVTSLGFETIRNFYTERLDLDPRNQDAALEFAKYLLEHGDLKEATKILKTHETGIAGKTLLTWIEYDQCTSPHAYSKVRESFEDLLAQSPNESELKLGYALSLLGEKYYRMAHYYLDKLQTELRGNQKLAANLREAESEASEPRLASASLIKSKAKSELELISERPESDDIINHRKDTIKAFLRGTLDSELRLKFLQEMIELDPENIDNKIAKAKALLDEGKYQDVVTILDPLQHESNEAKAMLGEAYNVTKLYNKAYQLFKDLAEPVSDTTDAAILFGYAISLHGKKWYRKANSILEKISTGTEESTNLYNQIKSLLKSPQLDKDELALLSTDEKKKRLKYIQNFIKTESPTGDTLIKFYEEYFLIVDSDNSLKPKLKVCLAYFDILYKAGATEEYKKILKLAEGMKPDNDKVKFRIACKLIDEKKFRAAKQKLEGLSDNMRGTRAVLSAYAISLAGHGWYRRANTVASKAKSSTDDYGIIGENRLNTVMGTIREELKKPQLVSGELASLDDDDKRHRLKTIRSLIASEKSKQDKQGNIERGRVIVNGGKIKAASTRDKLYQEARALFPEDADILLGHAGMYTEMNKPANALQVLEAASNILKQKPEIQSALLWSEYKNKKYTEGISRFESMPKISRSDSDKEAYALCLFKLKRYSDVLDVAADIDTSYNPSDEYNKALKVTKDKRDEMQGRNFRHTAKRRAAKIIGNLGGKFGRDGWNESALGVLTAEFTPEEIQARIDDLKRLLNLPDTDKNKCYTELITISNNSSEHILAYAEYLESTNDRNGAIVLLEEHLQGETKSFELQLTLAGLLSKDDLLKDQTLEAYRVAYELKPDSMEARLGYAEGLIDVNKWLRTVFDLLDPIYPDSLSETDKQSRATCLSAIKDPLSGPQVNENSLQEAKTLSNEAKANRIRVILDYLDDTNSSLTASTRLEFYEEYLSLGGANEDRITEYITMLSNNEKYLEIVQFTNSPRCPEQLTNTPKIKEILAWARLNTIDSEHIAVTDFRTLLEISPDSDEYKLGYGLSLVKQGWYRLAGSVLSEVNNGFKQILQEASEKVQAALLHPLIDEASIAELADLTPEIKEARSSQILGIIANLDNEQEKQKFLQELAALDPNSTSGKVIAADLQYKNGKYAGALAIYRLLPRGIQSTEEYTRKMAQCFLETNKYLEAIKSFENLLKTSSALSDKVGLARAYNGASRFTDTILLLSDIDKSEPGVNPAWETAKIGFKNAPALKGNDKAAQKWQEARLAILSANASRSETYAALKAVALSNPSKENIVAYLQELERNKKYELIIEFYRDHSNLSILNHPELGERLAWAYYLINPPRLSEATSIFQRLFATDHPSDGAKLGYAACLDKQ